MDDYADLDTERDDTSAKRYIDMSLTEQLRQDIAGCLDNLCHIKYLATIFDLEGPHDTVMADIKFQKMVLDCQINNISSHLEELLEQRQRRHTRDMRPSCVFCRHYKKRI